MTEADQAWVNQGMYAPKGSFELCLIKDRYNGKNPIFICENCGAVYEMKKK